MTGEDELRPLCLPSQVEGLGIRAVGCGKLKLDPLLVHLVAYTDWATLTNVYKFIACACVLAFRLIVAGSESHVNFMGRSLPIFCLCQRKSAAVLRN